MKMYHVSGFILILLLTILFTSCEKYHDDVLNGAVGIEIVKSPLNKSVAALDSNELPIEIKFSTHIALEEVYVFLFVEDAEKFAISDDSVELKDDSYLNSFPMEKEMIIDFKETNLTDKEFVFSDTVDLSAYPNGTCFVLFGTANGISEHSEGFDSNGIYFCKKGDE